MSGKLCYSDIFVNIVLQRIKNLNLTLRKTIGKQPENNQKLDKAVNSVSVVTRVYYNSKFSNVKGYKSEKMLYKVKVNTNLITVCLV